MAHHERFDHLSQGSNNGAPGMFGGGMWTKEGQYCGQVTRCASSIGTLFVPAEAVKKFLDGKKFDEKENVNHRAIPGGPKDEDDVGPIEFFDQTIINLGRQFQRQFVAEKCGGKKPKSPLKTASYGQTHSRRKALHEEWRVVPELSIVGGAFRLSWFQDNTFEFIDVDDQGAKWSLFQKAVPLAQAPFTPDQRQQRLRRVCWLPIRRMTQCKLSGNTESSARRRRRAVRSPAISRWVWAWLAGKAGVQGDPTAASAILAAMVVGFIVMEIAHFESTLATPTPPAVVAAPVVAAPAAPKASKRFAVCLRCVCARFVLSAAWLALSWPCSRSKQ